MYNNNPALWFIVYVVANDNFVFSMGLHRRFFGLLIYSCVAKTVYASQLEHMFIVIEVRVWSTVQSDIV